MESFSGKAAKEAKGYFNDLHKTILESFNGLFTDLDNNLKKHLDEFGSSVDSSDSAIIQSDYLKDTEEDVSDDYEELSEKHDTVNEIIDSVADISSATAPSFSKVTSNAEEAVKVITDLEEKLDSFTSTGDASQTKDLLHQIEVTMKNAKTNDGTARFMDYKGDSKNVGLAKLKDYNQGKMEEEMEKAKEAKASAIKDLNKHSSREVVNQAYTEFQNGEMEYDQFIAILSSVKNTSGNMSEKELKEESTENFIKYLEDRGLMEQYLKDHQTVAKYVVDNMPSILRKYIQGNVPIFLEKLGYDQLKLAERLMESDEIAKEVANKSDPKFTREIMQTIKKSGNFYKYAEYLKGAGKVLGGAGYIYGAYDDVKHNGKTVGQAVAHGGASLAIAIGVGLAISPAGWALAAGIGLTAVFEFAYNKNFKGIQDGLDKVGDKLSEWGSNLVDSVGEAVKNPVISAINPFAW